MNTEDILKAEIKPNKIKTKEYYELEKVNSIKCLEETRLFIKENKDITTKKIDLTSVSGFNEAMNDKKILEKLENKKKYVTFLESHILELDEKIKTF